MSIEGFSEQQGPDLAGDIAGPPVPERGCILLVDDDRKFARLLMSYLMPYGYSIDVAIDGMSAIKRVAESHWDLIMLDVMLPGWDGFDTLKRLRQISSIPVMMVSARGDEADRIVGLEVGADDYVPKSFSSRELLARIRALLRRTQGDLDSAVGVQPIRPLLIGQLRIEPAARRVFVADQEVSLTPIEYKLLTLLAGAAGTAKSREQLVIEARDGKALIHERVIDVHVSMLRRKLDLAETGAGGYVRTVRGVGYMLLEPSKPAE